jgi:hypothetical protein
LRIFLENKNRAGFGDIWGILTQISREFLHKILLEQNTTFTTLFQTILVQKFHKSNADACMLMNNLATLLD